MSDTTKIIKVKKTPGRKSGGARKIGRNILKCSTYKSSGTREKNKVRRYKKMLKHTKQYGQLERISNIKDWDLIKVR
jgi:hypothetical protein